jgi:ectoine hydroxylase-related dioxygenase (phytanoyl-CoA dioxygenase family)
MSQGFAVHEAVFTAVEMRELGANLQSGGSARSRAGMRHLMATPAVARLSRDPRLLALARAWAGPGAAPYRATLFDKSPAANWLVVWHQDTTLPLQSRCDAQGWGPWSLKAGIDYAHAPARALCEVIALRVHLDDCDDDNGPLRVLPGTQELGVLSDAQLQECARAIPEVRLHVAAGGVIAMRPLLAHASSKTRNDRSRRVLHIEYAPAVELEQGLRLRMA